MEKINGAGRAGVEVRVSQCWETELGRERECQEWHWQHCSDWGSQCRWSCRRERTYAGCSPEAQ